MKPVVQKPRKNGFWAVYIRFTFDGRCHFWKTSKVVSSQNVKSDVTGDVPCHIWLFDFQDRLSTSDSFNANVNAGISQICKKVSQDFHASLYSFRHSWATIAQSGCGASLGDVDFALNHSTYKMARVYTKIDYSPAWELNEKVIDYLFFSNEDIDNCEDSDNSFERMSKYNLIRGEAFVSGECVSVIENSGFTNVEQVITRLLSSFSDNISRPSKVQIKISNLDKKQTQLYQRILQ